MENSLCNRAMAAYFRSSAGHVPVQPHCVEVCVNSRAYVVLNNVNGTLAVYRVRTDGVLKRLVRWPGELDKL